MIDSFLTPLDADDFIASDLFPGTLANHLQLHTGGQVDLSGVDIALIGISDFRTDGLNNGTSLAANRVRTQLYRLMKPQAFGKVADLGNIDMGETVQDTLFALRTVLHELQDAGVLPVIIGGNEMLAVNQYSVLKEKSQYLDLVYIGKRVDLRENSVLYSIILDEPSHLFNMTSMGYQTYLTEQESLDAMERMFFESVRLGALRARMELAEPLLRSADMAIFDCSAIKQGDFPGHYDPSPNGLRSEEACQLARYAGLGHHLKSMGFYNYNPDYDNNNQSARQVAQMIWFFLEGYYQRREEHPLKQADQFLKYRMALKSNSYEVVFYKSKISDRWWMEIPHPNRNRENTIPLIIPCTYDDYMVAASEELPDRWWRFYQKYAV